VLVSIKTIETGRVQILLVEDNIRLGPLLTEALRGAGHSVDLVTTAKECLEIATSKSFELYVVDLGLPDEDGGRLISRLRFNRIQQPILIITARSGIEDRIAGLDLGADDYLIKPFNTAELLARIRALSRRPAVITSPLKQVGRLVLDVHMNEVSCQGVRVTLTPSEHRLLVLFLRRGGRIVTIDDIEQLSREFGRDVSGNGVQQSISRLRKQLGHLDPDLVIETIRGTGYVLSTHPR
jgi:DNA-binding response OmpR family regulator